MSHHLDIDGMSEKIILLQHFVYGSKTYCLRRLPGSVQDTGQGEFDKYWGWVKAIASNYTIECAIKFRIIQDTLEEKDNNINWNDLDKKSCNGLIIGTIQKGKFSLNLRESCNKIIHATRVVPVWSSDSIDDVEYNYWSGCVELHGEKQKKEWLLILNISEWAEAMENFIDLLEQLDASHDIGQDW
jgi:hypothetical protein